MKSNYPPKALSLIEKISISAPPFQKTDFVPTDVNLFFGANGSGKSTLARAMAKGDGLAFAEGKDMDSAEVLLFDTDFVNQNIRSGHHLPGVFMLGRENIDTTGALDALLRQKADLEKQEKEERDRFNQYQEETAAHNDLFLETLWKTGEAYRKNFPKALGKAKSSKRNFAAAMLAVSPSAIDDTDEDLAALYRQAFSDALEKLPPVPALPAPDWLDRLDGVDILKTPIVNRADIPFTAFMNALASADWFRYGHDHYEAGAKGRCPYCQQTLPEDFQSQVAQAFDSQYEEGKRRIDDFRARYEAAANRLMQQLQSVPEACAPRGSYQEYQARVMILGNMISENLRRIDQKRESPSKEIELSPLAPYLGDLSDLLTQWNRRVSEHNRLLDNRAAGQEECAQRIQGALAKQLAPTMAAYRTLATKRASESMALQKNLSAAAHALHQVQQEIAAKQSQFANTTAALTDMNRLLQKSGFQSFHLEAAGDNEYRVIRQDGSPAENLSEGEIQFLGYLYFCAKAFGQPEDAAKEKILLIDDPTGTLDSHSASAAAALTRELITATLAYNDPTVYRKKFQVLKESPIRQLFLFTHRSAFYQDITEGLETEWDRVAFFLVRKDEGVSTIEAGVLHTPPTWTNALPPLDSMGNLWHHYQKETDPAKLLLIARKIVARCLPPLGHEKPAIRRAILANQSRLTAQSGSPAPFRVAVSFLTYLDTAALSFSGLAQMPPALATQCIKDTLETLFTLLGQEAYYKSMVKKYKK